MTQDEAIERDIQRHESTHPGCNERYWRERALSAEDALAKERERCIRILEKAMAEIRRPQ